MNGNNRMASLVILALGVVGVPGLAYWFFLEPLWSLESTESTLAAEMEKANRESEEHDELRKRLFADHPRLEFWKEMSWPVAKDKLAERHTNDLQAEFRKKLETALNKGGLKKAAVELTRSSINQVNPAAKQGPNKALWQSTTFRVSGQGSLKDVGTVLEGVHSIPVLHRLASLDIKKPESERKNPSKDFVELSLTVEAISVVGAEKRENLEPTLKKMPVLLNPSRKHSEILANANPFVIVAPPPPVRPPTPPPTVERTPPKPSEDREDYLTSVKLTGISSYERGTRTGWVAYFYDQNTNSEQKVYSLGLNRTVGYQDQYGNDMLKAKVVSMNVREVILLSEDGYFPVVVGQDLFPAERRVLNQEQYKELGLEDPAKPEKKPATKEPDLE
ncbi:MAG: hypothetical protein ACKO9Z_00970 [Planctomycetota bacterium]